MDKGWARNLTICDAARISFAGVVLTFGSFALAQEDVAQGQKAFESQCASCHTVTPGVNGFGPSLAGVVGRPAGHVPGFTYSGAMGVCTLRR